jgi:hypothetical protein
MIEMHRAVVQLWGKRALMKHASSCVRRWGLWGAASPPKVRVADCIVSFDPFAPTEQDTVLDRQRPASHLFAPADHQKRPSMLVLLKLSIELLWTATLAWTHPSYPWGTCMIVVPGGSSPTSSGWSLHIRGCWVALQDIPCTTPCFKLPVSPHRALHDCFRRRVHQLNHQGFFFRPSRTSAVEPVVDMLIWVSSLCVGVGGFQVGDKDPTLSLLFLSRFVQNIPA